MFPIVEKILRYLNEISRVGFEYNAQRDNGNIRKSWLNSKEKCETHLRLHKNGIEEH